MSIPDRFYRIAKHKLGEMKDWFDKVDENDLDVQRDRLDARRELNDTLAPSGNPVSPSNVSSNSPSNQMPPSARSSGSVTPSYPTRNVGPAGGNSVPMNPPRSSTPVAGQSLSGLSGSGMPNANNNANSVTPVDPLDYHYRLLSLEPGADFQAVQAAYNRLAARCDPALFPAGSAEEKQARQIRERLDTSYKQLRDVLDTTTTRFGRLEF